MTSPYFKFLQKIADNPEQKRALDRNDHTLVIAGPGTGKTNTLVAKAAKLLYDDIFPPQGLACLTYAHSMVEQIRERMLILGLPPRSNVFVGTLHGFCLSNILLPFGKLYNYNVPTPLRVASDSQQAAIYREIWDGFRGRYALKGFRPSWNNARDGQLERLPIPFQKYRRTVLDGRDSSNSVALVEELVQMYEARLEEMGLVDFDLQTRWSMEIIEKSAYVRKAIAAKYPWILIDEYQDLGLPLHRMVKALARDTDIKLFVIGDPNQCIYDFTGADPKYLQELVDLNDIFTETIHLNRCYRSLPNIVSASFRVIGSELTHTRTDGSGHVEYILEEPQGHAVVDIVRSLHADYQVPYDKIMILGRTRADCDRIGVLLDQANPAIPCFKSVNTLYDARKPLLEWVETLIIYSIALKESPSGRSRKIADFWSGLLQLNGFSEHEARSLHRQVQLYETLKGSSSFANSAFSWLQKVAEFLELNQLLEAYSRSRPDDIEEYQRLLKALEPEGALQHYSLQEMLAHAERTDRVYIGTLHSSKGQESQAVILADTDELISKILEARDLFAARRLLYVGITRARDHLYLLSRRKTMFLYNLTRNLQRGDQTPIDRSNSE